MSSEHSYRKEGEAQGPLGLPALGEGPGRVPHISGSRPQGTSPAPGNEQGWVQGMDARGQAQWGVLPSNSPGLCTHAAPPPATWQPPSPPHTPHIAADWTGGWSQPSWEHEAPSFPAPTFPENVGTCLKSFFSQISGWVFTPQKTRLFVS